MRTTIKFERSSNGITQQNSLVNNHIMRFYNSSDAIWTGAKRYAH